MEFRTQGEHRGCIYLSTISITDRLGRVHIRTDVTIDLHSDAIESQQLAFRAVSPDGPATFASELEGWGMSRHEAEIHAAKIVRDRIDAIFGPNIDRTQL